MDVDLLETHKRLYKNLLKETNPTQIKRLHDDFLATYTYDAISLEGNCNLPIEEVRRVINTGFNKESNKRESHEILNHVSCYNVITTLVKDDKDLTEEQFKDLHDLLVKNIMVGGVYRNVNVRIIGGAHQPPDYLKVYDKMRELFDSLKTIKLDDFDKGVYLHANLAKIYPYVDGNGRVARLALNYYLIKAGLIPITISKEYKDEYFMNLEIFKVNKDIKPLSNFIIKLINEQYEKNIEFLDL